ncbi:MAG TPA: hypothetical protein VFS58_15710 [Steroidobacteraceae bacterium]|nr:hypothetical protein [Steroidobacteraceae bacterium]
MGLLINAAWLCAALAAALRVETEGGWTAILQALDGSTYIAPRVVWLDWRFASQSALLAKRTAAHMVAVRYDDFDGQFRDNPTASGSEEGNAWAVAYSFDRGKQWRFALEWLRVESYVRARVEAPGDSAFASETRLEFSARYLLRGSF